MRVRVEGRVIEDGQIRAVKRRKIPPEGKTFTIGRSIGESPQLVRVKPTTRGATVRLEGTPLTLVKRVTGRDKKVFYLEMDTIGFRLKPRQKIGIYPPEESGGFLKVSVTNGQKPDKRPVAG